MSTRQTALGLFLVVIICFFGTFAAEAQQPEGPQQWVDRWFVRLNGLDDWTPSADGKEDNSKVVNEFVQLHREDAFFQVSPSEDQIGPVVYEGHNGIRKWASDFSTKYDDLQYRLEFRTFGEETQEVFYTVNLPQQTIGVSVEFTAVYTDRKDKKRLFGPGAAFFLFDASGRIRNVRLYVPQNELAEVSR